MSPWVVAAFYKFVDLENHADLRAPLLALCHTHGVVGTILLAREGVNSTIAGSRAGIDAVLDWLRADPRLSDLEHKESTAPQQPFGRMKVRLKKEIVTLGVEVDPVHRVGRYVEPEDWNELISDPATLVLDTRNAYEVEQGRFEGAVDPGSRSFREFPEYVRRELDPTRHKRVAMYCTGGIRCEKASSYLLAQGFAEVYHLRGGILKYLEYVPEEKSLWRGGCFVFDERVALGHALKILA